MRGDGYQDGILIKTEFKENGFGIDPGDCGCTDCITGQAFHPGDYRIGRAITQGRTLYNRTGHEVILPNGWRLDTDQTWRPGTQHHCLGCNCLPSEGGQW